MKSIKTIFIVLCLLSISNITQAQESKFKALFLYKFAEYIEWPKATSKIVIGVAGNSDVYDQLSTFAASRGTFEVIKVIGSADITKCNIIFLPTIEEDMFSNYQTKIGSQSILLVTDNEKLVTKGSDIGFFLEDGKLRFLINPKSIESKKMIPSSKLLSLGKTI